RPFGDSYANMVKQHIYSSYNLDDIERLVAYVNHQPVGIVDIIMTDKTIEIDGFGVLEEFQHQGIGSEIQAYVGRMANERPVILVADGKDTAKDMYLRQGYVYQGFKYHILKENI
ncbi:MAG: GNAT family N-acetyltransferase, partial [Staphylococcus epidermidis]|nr:GNAT family N-acetyltransferase [Staphylococcus epidermidis]MDU2120791.1 GNAT family N-acetyltransferase [Staphylococcus aureus]MDU3925281.1 GNAT family N-acetyltransferase [Staphylococcus aureus]